MSSVTSPPAAAISIGVVGMSMGCLRRIAPMTKTRIAMTARKTPFSSAPMISAVVAEGAVESGWAPRNAGGHEGQHHAADG
jgi:hypothetical protein